MPRSAAIEVIPLTVQLPGLLVFAPPTALVGTARRSRRSLANVLLLTITLLRMPFVCTALLTFY